MDLKPRYFRASNNSIAKFLSLELKEAAFQVLDKSADAFILEMIHSLDVSSGIENFNKLVIKVLPKDPVSSEFLPSEKEVINNEITKISNRISWNSNTNIDIADSYRTSDSFLVKPKTFLNSSNSVWKKQTNINLQKTSEDEDSKIFPSKIVNKWFSAVKAVEDYSTEEKIIYETTIQLSSVLRNGATNFSCIEIVEDDKVVEENSGLRRRPDAIPTDEYLDPDDVVSFVNRNLFTLSQYSQEESFNFPHNKIFDYVNDFVDQPSLDGFRSVRSTKKISKISIPAKLIIPSQYKDSTLQIICKLYSFDSELPIEEFKSDITMSGYVEEFINSPVRGPQILASSSSNKHYIRIFSPDQESYRNIFGYKVYKRIIEKNGTLGKFEFLINLSADFSTKIAEFSFENSGLFEIVRVIPTYEDGSESHIFQDVTVGDSYEEGLGSLSMSVMTSKSDSLKNEIFIYNVPKDTQYLELYRRDCDIADSNFEVIGNMIIDSTIRNVTMVDRVSRKFKFEYFVAAISKFDTTLALSNYATHFYVEPYTNLVDVKLENKIVNINNINNPVISFTLSSRIANTVSSLVVNNLRANINEIYEKYVNPANVVDPAVTASEIDAGVPQISDLFFHEIIRTNKSTGEREIFEIVSDGQFEDSDAIRAKRGIKRINPQHSYIYQVFTYVRNPFHLFKNFVARGVRIGTDKSGNKSYRREWFYSPYKWLHPQVVNGRLFSTDDYGNPIIPDDENVKAQGCGLTAVFEFNGIKDQVDVYQVTANRASKSSVKISWEVNISSSISSSSLEPYDSFMVIAIVNGKKKYIGTTKSNFIYHRLTYNNPDLISNDYGSIYYAIIPILDQLKLDSVVYSNQIVIDPLELHNKISVY